MLKRCLVAIVIAGLPSLAGGCPPGEPGAVSAPYPVVDAGPVAVRRLTTAQYQQVVADLFGADLAIPDIAEPDLELGGLLSVGASSGSLSARGVESAEEAALAIAEQALATDARRAALVPCAPTGTVDDACARQFVQTQGERIWRRPLSDEEIDRISAIASNAATTLGDFHQGLTYALAALLQSPHFLFRVELGQGQSFTSGDQAARLSFFLWNTTPDEELLEAARRGELATEEGLMSQAERLLASPRARQGLRSFFDDYLHLYELMELSKDPTVFEHHDAQLGPDAREETLRLLEHLIFDADGDYRDVMTTRQTFLNPRLAALYGVPAPIKGEFGKALLPEDGGRAGLLGQASFLALHAHSVSSSATRRGKAVRNIFLCQQIPSPPVDVDTSIPEPSGTTLTLRDRVKEHLENPSCAGCHSLTDPIGLALENFDGLGRWRLTDNGAPIDPSGELDGEAFADARGLGEAVKNHPAFASCLVRMLVRYANGRVETQDEEALITALTERFAGGGYRVLPLLTEIVASPLFRNAGPRD